MRIIGLYGHANCGKTETLNDLKELLRSAGRSVSSVPHPHCDMPETFLYKGLTICVAPGGDTRKIVEDNCRYFDKKQCDVAISATRTKYGSAVALTEYAKDKGSVIKWHPKSYEYYLSKKTQVMCNKEVAEVLFKMI